MKKNETLKQIETSKVAEAVMMASSVPEPKPYLAYAKKLATLYRKLKRKDLALYAKDGCMVGFNLKTESFCAIKLGSAVEPFVHVVDTLNKEMIEHVWLGGELAPWLNSEYDACKMRDYFEKKEQFFISKAIFEFSHNYKGIDNSNTELSVLVSDPSIRNAMERAFSLLNPKTPRLVIQRISCDVVKYGDQFQVHLSYGGKIIFMVETNERVLARFKDVTSAEAAENMLNLFTVFGYCHPELSEGWTYPSHGENQFSQLKSLEDDVPNDFNEE